MRWTTGLSLGIFFAVALAVAIYAYSDSLGSPGFIGDTWPALAALLAVLLVSVIAARRWPRSLDLVVLLAAIGVVALSWSEIRATADADSLVEAISEAGDAAAEVLAETETDAGELIEEIVSRRNMAAAAVAPLFDDLWDEEILAIVSGPDAEDSNRLNDAQELAEQLLAVVDDRRAGIGQEFDDLTESVTSLESELPEARHASVRAAALGQIEAQRDAFLAAMDLAAARLEAGARAARVLSTFPGDYEYDPAAEEVRLQTLGARQTATAQLYRNAVEAARSGRGEIELTLIQQAEVSAEDIAAMAAAAAGDRLSATRSAELNRFERDFRRVSAHDLDDGRRKIFGAFTLD